MKISELKKIYSDESDPEFKSVSSKVLDALLEIAELVRECVICGHHDYCSFYNSNKCICGVSDFEAAIAKLEGVEG